MTRLLLGLFGLLLLIVVLVFGAGALPGGVGRPR